MGVGKKIIRGFIFLSSAELISGIFAFIITIYLARVLGPSHFGVIAFAMALLTYFSLGSHLGLDTYGARMIAREKDKVKSYAQQILPLKFIIGIFSFLVLNILIILTNKSSAEKMVISLFSLSIFPTMLLIEWIFQGLERFNLIGISKIITNIIYLMLVILYVKNTGNVNLVPLLRLISLSISASFLLFFFFKSFGWFVPKINLSIWITILFKSWPMGIYAVMAIIMANLSMVMLGFMRSNEEVGYYGVAFRLMSIWLVLVSAYLKILYPIVSRFYITSLESLRRVVSQSMKLVLTFAIPIILGGIILASRLILIMYGEAYLKGTLALQILLWSILFNSVNSVISWTLLASNREKVTLRILCLQTFFNIFLNFLLIPKFGIEGAAFATTISEFIGVYFNYFALRVLFHLDFINYIVRQFISAIVMVIFLYYYFNFNLFFIIIGGVLIYFICLTILGGISKEELQKFYGYLFINSKNEVA